MFHLKDKIPDAVKRGRHFLKVMQAGSYTADTLHSHLQQNLREQCHVVKQAKQKYKEAKEEFCQAQMAMLIAQLELDRENKAESHALQDTELSNFMLQNIQDGRRPVS